MTNVESQMMTLDIGPWTLDFLQPYVASRHRRSHRETDAGSRREVLIARLPREQRGRDGAHRRHAAYSDARHTRADYGIGGTGRPDCRSLPSRRPEPASHAVFAAARL